MTQRTCWRSVLGLLSAEYRLIGPAQAEPSATAWDYALKLLPSRVFGIGLAFEDSMGLAGGDLLVAFLVALRSVVVLLVCIEEGAHSDACFPYASDTPPSLCLSIAGSALDPVIYGFPRFRCPGHRLVYVIDQLVFQMPAVP